MFSYVINQEYKSKYLKWSIISETSGKDRHQYLFNGGRESIRSLTSIITEHCVRVKRQIMNKVAMVFFKNLSFGVKLTHNICDVRN